MPRHIDIRRKRPISAEEFIQRMVYEDRLRRKYRIPDGLSLDQIVEVLQGLAKMKRRK